MTPRSLRTASVAVAVAVAVTLGLAGCGPSDSDVAATPTATRAPSQTPTPTPTPTPKPPTTPVSQVAPPAPLPEQPEPQPAPQPDPNAVDNANYASHAIDTVNGGALAGVEFMSADGQIICGITGPGGVAQAGSADCTPSTWETIIPQMEPEHGPSAHAAMVSRGGSTSYLIPDWFSQPARTIPVLPAGKVIAFEGLTCAAAATDIRCSDDATGAGFVVSLESVTFF